MKALKVTTENPELNDRFNRVLNETVEAMEESGIRYVFIGGIASHGLGRPRSTHDIDLFVRPEDAELVLRALAKHGFRTEKTDPAWLYKGFKENILVDVIFKSKGEIYFDSEMFQRVTTAEFHGKELRLVSPEDLVIIKALAHSEATPGHWHDALAILSHANLDWDYLVRRGRRAPRRLLSLLLYAQSSDVHVPKGVIDQLYVVIFGDMPPSNPTQPTPMPPPRMTSLPPRLAVPLQSAQGGGQSTPVPSPSAPSHPMRPLRSVSPQGDALAVAKLREHLAQDERTNELDIQIECAEGKILLRGEVVSEDRKGAINHLTRELLPGYQVENQIRVPDYPAPDRTEEVE